MRLDIAKKALALGLGLTLLAGCGGGAEEAADGPVELSFWAWAPDIDKVVDKWNAAHPETKVVFSKQAQGDDLVTKLLTSAKGGNPPDLAQVEFQALPTLVSNDVLADISEGAASAEDEFAPGIWDQVTLGGSGVYAVPQDSGPMMFYYRADLFEQYGLKVPTTWDEYARTARDLRAAAPDKFLGTFSANDPGWFAGLAQQAGASWWAVDGDAWKVSVDDAATRKVAQYWQGLVAEGAIDKSPMYTPEWNKALNDGTQVGWLSAVWAPGVLKGNAESTQGKWAMAPMPQWDAAEPRTGNWGGSTTAVTAGSKKQKAATEFALWLNTDPAAVEALVTVCGIYPAATSAQEALAKPPAFFPNQPDFYARAAKIAATSSGFTWGPNVNVTYTAYKNAMGEAVSGGADLVPALAKMQTATVDDMKANGFTVGG
ncbi:ABC transporter substrate-binding protein [Saccharothrix texasensis]|uniref:Carbohydrate ABC transporter substrate-binding protein (CUT1 family) n=1 Tax=Saccharothrix texasensis TaxID=103734 RepID=A0A3N1H6J4_9PSEU|nr:extracellular solute-binding protein [Saccharothrix texasensis]ROP38173.1 carbohydrate ABC transporter substrate-binding protein (CUT1 family) [Saccharothrix texasensis]